MKKDTTECKCMARCACECACGALWDSSKPLSVAEMCQVVNDIIHIHKENIKSVNLLKQMCSNTLDTLNAELDELKLLKQKLENLKG